jgi:ABC-type glycerol-3-phosphate transport system permease component
MIKKRRFLPKPVIIILHIIFLIIALSPIYSTLIISLTPDSELLTPQIYPRFFDLSTYARGFNLIFKNVVNSFIYALISTSIVALVSIPASYVLAKYPFKFKQVVLFLILVTQMMAGIIILPTLYSSLNRFGLINRVGTLIFVLSSVNLALSVWLLYGYFKTIPTEIEDAARIDGVSYIPFLIKIIIPISGPGIAVSSIFVFVNTYNEFVIPLFLLTDRAKYPLTLTLYSLLTDTTIRWNVLASASLLAIIPPIIIFFIFQKYVISGLVAGSVKS